MYDSSETCWQEPIRPSLIVLELDWIFLGARYLERRIIPKLRLPTAAKRSEFSSLGSRSGICPRKDKSQICYHWSNPWYLHPWRFDAIQINPSKTQLCSCHFSSYKTLMDKVLPLNRPDILGMLQLLLAPIAYLVTVSPPILSYIFLFLIKGCILNCWTVSCTSKPPKNDSTKNGLTSNIHLDLCHRLS